MELKLFACNDHKQSLCVKMLNCNIFLLSSSIMVTSTVDVIKKLTPLSETIPILNVSLGSGTLSSLRKKLASFDVSSTSKETNFP